MSQTRPHPDAQVLVRFWSLDHYRAEPILWSDSPWDKLVFAEEGTLVVETSREHHVLPPNRAIFVPAGKAHPSRTLGRARVRTLFFAPSMRLARDSGVLEVCPLFRELIGEACRTGPLSADVARDAAIAFLLSEEIRTAPKIQTSIRMPQSEWLLTWARGYVEGEPSTLPTGFSHRTVERRMRVETGLSYGQWCRQARALRGLRALSCGATVVEAAMAADFETVSGFIQSYRKQFGSTPGKIKAGLNP